MVPRQHHSREVHHNAALQSVWTGKGSVRRSKRMGCNLTARSISSFLLIVIVYCVQVMNKAGNSSLCLDFLQKNEHKTYKLGQYPCHSKLYSSQVLVDVLLPRTSRWCWECNGNGFSVTVAQCFSLTFDGQLRREETCAQVRVVNNNGSKEEAPMPVEMVSCPLSPTPNLIWSLSPVI